MGMSRVLKYRLVTYDGLGRKSPHYWGGTSEPTQAKLIKALKEYPDTIRAEIVLQATNEVVLTWENKS